MIETDTPDIVLQLLNLRRHIDLVFADINLPGEVDGDELAADIIRDHPGLKVLLTTGDSLADSPTHLPVLHKPFSATELTEQVRSILDG